MALPKIVGHDPFYFGIEEDADGKVLSISWMVQPEPPSRHGKAVRVRFGKTAYHLGICRKRKKPFVREVENTPEEIGKWVY